MTYMDEATKKILEIVTDTQERVARMEGDTQYIKKEVGDIRVRFDMLEEQVRGQRGYAKEIDALMARISAVEKHVGIKA